MKKVNEHLIVALDGMNSKQALAIVDELGDAVQYYKVGMDLFYKMDNGELLAFVEKGKRLFIDLKLHDIPSMVQSSIKSLCQFQPEFLSVHASGGLKMLKAAVKGAEEWARENHTARPKIIAITVLTSLSEQDWADVGAENSIREAVLRMSLVCKEAGVDGVIASPQESSSIRALCGPDFIIATPGIRLMPDPNSDQARTATPVQALSGGTDYIVVGRPILHAASHGEVVKAILENISQFIQKG
ncbi:orotidine-5'-phosphate decarboxylase [Sporomusa aerivorans]|uniref:orotidine-5'-phosphate decarboxylase n=1 Tax=Sporomusa aerivorans TaxID=204936 RepID=UPI00352A676E